MRFFPHFFIFELVHFRRLRLFLFLYFFLREKQRRLGSRLLIADSCVVSFYFFKCSVSRWLFRLDGWVSSRWAFFFHFLHWIEIGGSKINVGIIYFVFIILIFMLIFFWFFYLQFFILFFKNFMKRFLW